MKTDLLPLASPNFGYPINWITWDRGANVHIEINTATEAYARVDLERHVRAVLRGLAQTDHLLTLLRHNSADALQRALVTHGHAPVSDVITEFDHQANDRPDRVALTQGDAQSERMAEALLARLASEQSEVIVAMDRTPRVIAAILAVLSTRSA